jgi:environmental stress-induced protein Ves
MGPRQHVYMKTTVIQKESYARSRWKNGLGYTDQIAIHPENADLKSANFLWRLSSAAIEQSSEFSLFPNHDRVLMILKGVGLKLTHHFPEMGEEETVELPRLEAYEFPGDVKSRCELIDGPIVDLSVFIRKGEVSARVNPFTVESENQEFIPEGRWNFIHVLSGTLGIVSEAGEWAINAGDSFRFEGNRPEDLRVIQLRAHGPTVQAVSIAIG